jgi:uncharacterized membrane protein (UPF0136 family)
VNPTSEIVKVAKSMSEAQKTRKRGSRDALMIIVAAALIMIPSFAGRIAMSRLKLPVSLAAIMSLVLFVVGVFLLLKVLHD